MSIQKGLLVVTFLTTDKTQQHAYPGHNKKHLLASAKKVLSRVSKQLKLSANDQKILGSLLIEAIEDDQPEHLLLLVYCCLSQMSKATLWEKRDNCLMFHHFGLNARNQERLLIQVASTPN